MADQLHSPDTDRDRLTFQLDFLYFIHDRSVIVVLLQLVVVAQLKVSVHHSRTFPSFFESTSYAGSLSHVCTSPAPLVYFELTLGTVKFFIPPLACSREPESGGNHRKGCLCLDVKVVTYLPQTLRLRSPYRGVTYDDDRVIGWGLPFEVIAFLSLPPRARTIGDGISQLGRPCKSRG